MIVGIDTGGTFTDFVCVEGRKVRIHKVSSTPSDPTQAILRGLTELLGDEVARELLYGTTVATNALIERRGVKTALVTTEGFEDVIEIGRQVREKIYDMNVTARPPLVMRALRVGLSERVTSQGVVEKPLSTSAAERLAKKLRASGVESVAVCLLNSFANPVNERAVRRIISRFVDNVSASCDILPEYREYERFSTTCANAYVAPLLERHVSKLCRELRLPRFLVMQSNGGFVSAARTGEVAVHSILSGPAAGVLGAFRIARAAGFSKVITFDMGGTSTDVSLCDGRISFRTDTVVGGVPIKAPIVDVHTVGAGGGSIAWVDRGGVLRVGPHSAGAEPGPACYGKGKDPTVTDANLVLGRLSAEHFLGGRMQLHPDRAKAAMVVLSRKLGISGEKACQAVVSVANAAMLRAIRVVSVERGQDPSLFTLVAFGGAAPLHAAELARELSIKHVLVPAMPGVLSARGLLYGDLVRDYSQTVLIRDGQDGGRMLERAFQVLEARANKHLLNEGIFSDRRRLERYVDVRYVGQSYEITMPHGRDIPRRFHEAHLKLYGHSSPEKETEVVNVRVRAVGKRNGLCPAKTEAAGPRGGVGKPRKNVPVYDLGRLRRTPLYERSQFYPGSRLRGPAVIVEESSTTFLPGDVRCVVDERGNLILET